MNFSCYLLCVSFSVFLRGLCYSFYLFTDIIYCWYIVLLSSLSSIGVVSFSLWIYFLVLINTFLCNWETNRPRAPIVWFIPDANNEQDRVSTTANRSDHNPGLQCGWQEANYFSYHCCLPGSAWVGSRRQDLEPGIKPRHSNVGHLTTGLAAHCPLYIF